jgi:thiosulfate/3-mercaptopyruvate sulfurtransferase
MELIMDLLVTTDWLAQEIDAPDLSIVDASYFPLDPARDAAVDYQVAHIPGAVFLDLATLKDAANPELAMAPTAEAFARRMRELGINDRQRIILYDNSPHHTAARAWWLFKLFGAPAVAILDGGLAKWQAEGRALAQGEAKVATTGHFTTRRNDQLLRSKAEVVAAVAARSAQIIDARGAARFTGSEADPRGLPSGHIPGSVNLPYTKLFNADRTWKRGATLQAEFTAAGIDWQQPLISSCGSGVTAAILLFGMALLGKTDVALYDGSWNEWAADPTTAKATG